MYLPTPIPVEICYTILDELIPQYNWSIGSKREILVCSQVSQTFRSYLLPVLFKNAPCYSSTCIQSLYDLLVANPRLAPLIKSFALVRGGKGSKWSRDVNWVAKDLAIPTVADLLVNTLQEFTLETSLDCGHLAWAGMRGHVRNAVQALVSSPSLRTFRIKQFEVSQEILQSLSSSIQHLTLEGVRVAPSALINLGVLPRQPSRLTTLKLWHSPLATQILAHTFSEHGFPELVTIELEDRGLLDHDVRSAKVLMPLSPSLRVLQTSTKSYFRGTPSILKGLTRSDPFTQLVLSSAYDPSFATTLQGIAKWLSDSLDLPTIQPPSTPPPAQTTPAPSTSSTPSSTPHPPSSIIPSSPPFLLPPRSTLTHLTLSFDATNAHLSARDTADRVYGQMRHARHEWSRVGELLRHPEYASIDQVLFDFATFGFSESQESKLRSTLLGWLHGKGENENENENGSEAHSTNMTFTFVF